MEYQIKCKTCSAVLGSSDVQQTKDYFCASCTDAVRLDASLRAGANYNPVNLITEHPEQIATIVRAVYADDPDIITNNYYIPEVEAVKVTIAAEQAAK